MFPGWYATRPLIGPPASRDPRPRLWLAETRGKVRANNAPSQDRSPGRPDPRWLQLQRRPFPLLRKKNIPIVSRVDNWTKYQGKDIIRREGMKKERQRCGKHGTKFSTAVLVCVVCKQMTNDATWLLCGDCWVLSFQNNICLSLALCSPAAVLQRSEVRSCSSQLTSKINYQMFLAQVSRPLRGSVMRSTMQSRLLMIAFDTPDPSVVSQHK